MSEIFGDQFSSDCDALARKLAGAFGALRLPVSTEAAMQDAIEQALAVGGYDFKREWVLGERGRIDFLVEAADGAGVGIEAKIKSSRRRFAEQLARYAAHSRVGALVAVSNVPIPLPGFLRGKPVYFVSAGRAYL